VRVRRVVGRTVGDPTPDDAVQVTAIAGDALPAWIHPAGVRSDRTPEASLIIDVVKIVQSFKWYRRVGCVGVR
jgi:hypothetical protein